MSFSGLLCHLADLKTKTQVNTDGRISESWTSVGTIKCRFTQPSPSVIKLTKGADEGEIHAYLFAGMDLEDLTKSAQLPARISTTAYGWAGTYEIRTRPKVIMAMSNPHHTECDVIKLHAEGSSV